MLLSTVLPILAVVWAVAISIVLWSLIQDGFEKGYGGLSR